MPDMQGKTVVVTGGNSGIGFETAAALAAMGARVIVTARNADKGRAAVAAIGAAARGRRPRSSSSSSTWPTCRRCGGAPTEILEQAPRLDVLVNNAGLVLTERAETVDGFEATFATNHLGPFLLTNLLLDRIRASAPPGSSTWPRPRTAPPASGIPFDDLQSDAALPPDAGLRAVEAGQHPLHARAGPAARGQRASRPTRCIPGPCAPATAPTATPGGCWPSASRSAVPSSSRRPRAPAPRSTWPPRPRWPASAGSTSSSASRGEPKRWAQDPDAAQRLWQVSEELVGLAPDPGEPERCGSWSPARRGPSAGPPSRCWPTGATRSWRPRGTCAC